MSRQYSTYAESLLNLRGIHAQSQRNPCSISSVWLRNFGGVRSCDEHSHSDAADLRRACRNYLGLLRPVPERGLPGAVPAAAGKAVPQAPLAAAEWPAEHLGGGNRLRHSGQQPHIRQIHAHSPHRRRAEPPLRPRARHRVRQGRRNPQAGSAVSAGRAMAAAGAD